MKLSATEIAQLEQTIEMFEVIAQSDAHDTQSLEILKEAYSKLGRAEELVATAKRIARAYETTGALSSAILEYESILEQRPDDPDAKKALENIVKRADSFGGRPASPETDLISKPKIEPVRTEAGAVTRSPLEKDDGRERMRKVLVEGRHLNAEDFEKYWDLALPKEMATEPREPFLQVLANQNALPVDKSLKLVCDESRLCYMPLAKYDVEIDWVKRTFPKEICLRWCLLPFDHMSKSSALIATANPFNKRAAAELRAALRDKVDWRFLWYLASPAELLTILGKVFR